MAHNTATLSPLDQLMPRTHITNFLVFESQSPEHALSRLQFGLRRVCANLPYLKGRIVHRANERNQLAIVWNDNDSEIKIQRMPTPEELPGFAGLDAERAPVHYFPLALIPVSPYADHSGEGAPVFVASWTQLGGEGGGFILGIGVHHNVVDGAGLSEIMRMWAESSCTENLSASGKRLPDSAEPVRRHAWIRERSPFKDDETVGWTIEQLLQKHPEYTLLSKLKPSATSTEEPAAAPSAPAATSKIFTLSGTKLAELKRMLAASNVPPSHLTVNNIVTSLIWSHITYARNCRTEGCLSASTSKFCCAVNGRNRMGQYSEDKPYLGNVTLYAIADRSIDALSSTATNHTAENLTPILTAIATAVGCVNAGHVAEVAGLVDRITDVTDVIPGVQAFGGPDLLLTSWATLGTYGLDFGESVGQPKYMRLPFVPVDGLVVVLPRRRERNPETQAEHDDIEIAIMIREDDMRVLSNNPAWQDLLVVK